jgi:hypothetical protein
MEPIHLGLVDGDKTKERLSPQRLLVGGSKTAAP